MTRVCYKSFTIESMNANNDKRWDESLELDPSFFGPCPPMMIGNADHVNSDFTCHEDDLDDSCDSDFESDEFVSPSLFQEFDSNDDVMNKNKNNTNMTCFIQSSQSVHLPLMEENPSVLNPCLRTVVPPITAASCEISPWMLSNPTWTSSCTASPPTLLSSSSSSSSSRYSGRDDDAGPINISQHSSTFSSCSSSSSSSSSITMEDDLERKYKKSLRQLQTFMRRSEQTRSQIRKFGIMPHKIHFLFQQQP